MLNYANRRLIVLTYASSILKLFSLWFYMYLRNDSTGLSVYSRIYYGWYFRRYSWWKTCYAMQMMQSKNKVECMEVLKWPEQNWGMTVFNMNLLGMHVLPCDFYKMIESLLKQLKRHVFEVLVSFLGSYLSLCC